MNTHGITAEDLFHLQSVTDPQLSPDGHLVMYVQTSIDRETEKYISNLYLYNVLTKETKQWTTGQNRHSSPRWSPDGKYMSFVSNQSGSNQLYVMSSAGGEAKQITNLKSEVSPPIWSPCSTKLLFSTSRPASDQEEYRNEEKKTALRFERIQYKSEGQGYFNGLYKHLAVVDVLTEEIEFLTKGRQHYSPSAWSPDGKHITYVSKTIEQGEYDFISDIFTMDISTKKSVNITNRAGFFYDPKWSPNGEYLSFLGHKREFLNATLAKIWLYDINKQTTSCLTEGWDVELGNSCITDFQMGAVDPGILWTNDSARFYFLMSDDGNTGVYYGSIEGAMYPSILENQHIYGLSIDPNHHQAVVAISTPTNPGELYYFNLMNGQQEQISFVNTSFVQNKSLAEAEAISWKAKDGLDLHGWLIKPVCYEEGKTYPLILEIHGGPHLMYGNSYMHEFQALANEGYTILYTNPRGSVGYGQQFVNACRGDYGGMDYEDLISAVDYVTNTYDFIDRNKLGVSGGSYGGFMTNWIVGHTDRFKAAVSQRSISNWFSFYGVSDIGYYFTEWQLEGDIFQTPEKLWNHSPLKYAANIQTPLLLLHGEKDLRCPLEQSEQLFIALKRQKKETTLIIFPDETHEITRNGSPNMRLQHLQEIKNWFNKHIRNLC
ncbi:S9 family peptidase [Peribacillus asahii]|uniref:S9 family peptidase n=1 Tax=Peribacillus asahii TaxID=228899 RepID=UPI00207A7180|nr:S9 family peptidase [Peribacillus asahii]USK83496.1 S9 family peptidase [Peribacillus asahii]